MPIAQTRRGIHSDKFKFEQRCLELKRRGHAQHEICMRLRANPKQVSEALLRGLSKRDFQIEQHKELALQTLDELKSAWYGRAIGDEVQMVQMDGRDVPIRRLDMDAAKLVLSIEERKSRLLGLDAPKQVDIDAKVRQTHAIDDQLRELIMGSGREAGSSCQVPSTLAAPSKTVTIDSSGELV